MTSAATALAARTLQNETDIEVMTAMRLNAVADEYTIVAGPGVYVTYNYVAKTITISTSPLLASLDFSAAANSQYLTLVSVGGM